MSAEKVGSLCMSIILSVTSITSAASPFFLQTTDDFSSLARSYLFTFNHSLVATSLPTSSGRAALPPSSSSSSNPASLSDPLQPHYGTTLLQLTGRKQDNRTLTVACQTLSESDVFSPGDTILRKRPAEKAVVSSPLQLRIFMDTPRMAFASRAAEDKGISEPVNNQSLELVDNACGATVRPTVIPSIVVCTEYNLSRAFLQMTDELVNTRLVRSEGGIWACEADNGGGGVALAQLYGGFPFFFGR